MLSQLRQTIRASAQNSTRPTSEPLDVKTELHNAAANGDLDKVRELLSTGDVTVDAVDKWGYYALLRAAERGQTQCVEFLLQQGTQAQHQLHSKWCENTPLILAAENGHCEVVHQLLQAGADPQATDAFGNTTLHKAVSYNHLGVVWELVSHGVDINASNKYKLTAAHIAARNGYQSILELLLSDPKCDVNLQDIDETTPLFHACRWGWPSCVALLLENGAHFNQDLEADKCPFNEALQNNKYSVCGLLIASMFKVDYDIKSLEVEPWDSLVTLVGKVLSGPQAADVHPYLKAIFQNHMRHLPLNRRQRDTSDTAEMGLCIMLVKSVHMETISATYGEELLVDIAFNWRCSELLRCIYEAGHCYDPIHLIDQGEYTTEELTFKKAVCTIRDQMNHPRSLKSLSRIAIRKKLDLVTMKMDSLPLPKPVRMYLIDL